MNVKCLHLNREFQCNKPYLGVLKICTSQKWLLIIIRNGPEKLDSSQIGFLPTGCNRKGKSSSYCSQSWNYRCASKLHGGKKRRLMHVRIETTRQVVPTVMHPNSPPVSNSWRDFRRDWVEIGRLHSFGDKISSLMMTCSNMHLSCIMLDIPRLKLKQPLIVFGRKMVIFSRASFSYTRHKAWSRGNSISTVKGDDGNICEGQPTDGGLI